MESQPPRFLDTVRSSLRARHYSLRTETAHVAWIRRFIVFHGKRHPETMGTVEVNAFLTHLAVDGHVSASTQNQALAALLFLYESVLRSPLPDIGQRDSSLQACPTASGDDARGDRGGASTTGRPALDGGNNAVRQRACVFWSVSVFVSRISILAEPS